MTTNSTNGGEKGWKAPHSCDLCHAAEQYRNGIDREENLALICEAVRPDLLGYFRGRGVSADTADDLIQETMVAVTTNLDNFRGEACVRTWIRRIATNKLHLRWRDDPPWDDDDEPNDGEPRGARLPSEGRSPEQEAILDELRKWVRDAVKKLPPRRRACIELFYFQDRSYEAIARILNIEVGAVGATLWQAKDQLKKIFGECIDVDEEL